MDMCTHCEYPSTDNCKECGNPICDNCSNSRMYYLGITASGVMCNDCLDEHGLNGDLDVNESANSE